MRQTLHMFTQTVPFIWVQQETTADAIDLGRHVVDIAMLHHGSRALCTALAVEIVRFTKSARGRIYTSQFWRGNTKTEDVFGAGVKGSQCL